MKIRYYVTLFFAFSFSLPMLYSNDIEDFSYLEEPLNEEVSLSQDSLTEETPMRDFDLEEFDDVPDTTLTRQSDNPCGPLSTLYEFKAYKLLENDLYNYTYPLPSRNILKNPLLQNFVPKQSNFNFSIFYEQQTNLFACCNGIDGYLNLLSENFLQELDLKILENIDIPKVIGLFRNGWAEQRRIGLYFSGWKNIKNFSLGFEIPLYVAERNFNFLLEDQQEIKENIAEITTQFGVGGGDAPTEQEQRQAFMKYLVETRLGIGDTRLTLGWQALNTDRLRLVIAPKIILPTATTITSGILGTGDFKKELQRCCIDVQALVEGFESGDMSEVQKAQCMLLQAANQAGALMLSTDLGEDHRFQVGLCIQPEIRIEKQVSLIGALNLNWQLPKRVKRYILEQQNPADFIDSNFNPDDFPDEGKEAHCRQVLCFLSQRLCNWFFPCDYSVNLKGLFEFQFTGGAQFQFNDNWTSIVGYDYWRKEKECAKSVRHQCTPVSLASIKLPRALVSTLTQQSLFLKLRYTKFKESHNFVLNFGAALPLISHGISDTYTGFINLEWDF